MKNKLTAILLILSFYGYSQDDYLVKKPLKQDTIPVIMLVCDTSTHGKLLPYEIPNVFWIRGYEVIKKLDLKEDVWVTTRIYLDKNKKPTNLVVWDRRKI